MIDWMMDYMISSVHQPCIAFHYGAILLWPIHLHALIAMTDMQIMSHDKTSSVYRGVIFSSINSLIVWPKCVYYLDIEISFELIVCATYSCQ